MSLATTASVRIATALASALDMVTPRADMDQSFSMNLTSGTGANQADQVFSDERTLASEAVDNLDLSDAANALKNPLGVSLVLARVKLLFVRADPTNTTNLTVGNGATPWAGPFTGPTESVVLKPGDCCLFYSPGAAAYPVTATTADLLTITNGTGASAKYKIIIVGATA